MSVMKEAVQAYLKSHPEAQGKELGLLLLKSIYGLKQAPQLFNQLFHEALISLGLTQLKSEPCVYFSVRNGLFLLVGVFVDDSLITGTDEELKLRVKEEYRKRFSNKDGTYEGTWEDEASHFCGIRITQTPNEITLDVEAGINKLFAESRDEDRREVHLGSCHPTSIPYSQAFEKCNFEVDPKPLKLTKHQEFLKANFANITGSFIWFSGTCRPDITTLTNKACQGMHSPRYLHILYLEQAVRYLKRTGHYRLVYSRRDSKMTKSVRELANLFPELEHLPRVPFVVFTDSDWATMTVIEERCRSTSGEALYLFGCLIRWASKRQKITANSSMQAELDAASSGSDTAVWCANFMSETKLIWGIAPKDTPPPVPQLVDNRAALAVANHPMNHSKLRHWYVREFRIRDFQEAKLIRVYWCPTAFNIADHFTKPLKDNKFPQALTLLGIEGSPFAAPPHLTGAELVEATAKMAEMNYLHMCLHAQADYVIWQVSHCRVVPW